MSKLQPMSGPQPEDWDDDVYAGDPLLDPEDDPVEYDELDGIEWPVPDDDFGSY